MYISEVECGEKFLLNDILHLKIKPLLEERVALKVWRDDGKSYYVDDDNNAAVIIDDENCGRVVFVPYDSVVELYEERWVV